MINSYFKAWSNALLATQVVYARMPILYMLMLDPTETRQREARRMFEEKQTALLEGIAAAQFMAYGAMTDMMVNNGAKSAGILDYVDAMTAPAERILKANAKRLG